MYVSSFFPFKWSTMMYRKSMSNRILKMPPLTLATIGGQYLKLVWALAADTAVRRTNSRCFFSGVLIGQFIHNNIKRYLKAKFSIKRKKSSISRKMVSKFWQETYSSGISLELNLGKRIWYHHDSLPPRSIFPDLNFKSIWRNRVLAKTFELCFCILTIFLSMVYLVLR